MTAGINKLGKGALLVYFDPDQCQDQDQSKARQLGWHNWDKRDLLPTSLCLWDQPPKHHTARPSWVLPMLTAFSDFHVPQGFKTYQSTIWCTLQPLFSCIIPRATSALIPEHIIQKAHISSRWIQDWPEQPMDNTASFLLLKHPAKPLQHWTDSKSLRRMLRAYLGRYQKLDFTWGRHQWCTSHTTTQNKHENLFFWGQLHKTRISSVLFSNRPNHHFILKDQLLYIKNLYAVLELYLTEKSVILKKKKSALK